MYNTWKILKLFQLEYVFKKLQIAATLFPTVYTKPQKRINVVFYGTNYKLKI